MVKGRPQAKPGPKPRPNPLASFARAEEFVKSELGPVAAETLVAEVRGMRFDSTRAVLGDVAEEIRRTSEVSGIGWHLKSAQHQLRLLAAAELSAALYGGKGAPTHTANYESYDRWIGDLGALRLEIDKAWAGAPPTPPTSSGEKKSSIREQRAFAKSLLLAHRGDRQLTGLLVAALAVLLGVDRPAMCPHCSAKRNDLLRLASSAPRGSKPEREAGEFVCAHPYRLEQETRRREDLWRKHLGRLRKQLPDKAT